MSTPTDEERVELVAAVIYDVDHGEGHWQKDSLYEALGVSDYYAEPYIRFRDTARETARQVLAALEPPVTPLAPGETVTIPDMWGYPHTFEFARSAELDSLRLGHGPVLDAGGVAQLIATARRWQAAQGEGV